MTEFIRSTTELLQCRPKGVQEKRLKESCQDFEAVLVGFLFKTMRQSIMRSDEPDGGMEVYESMVDEAVAREMSRQEQIGLSRLLYESLNAGITGPKSGE
ncbi:MAG: hypothetical protein GX443_05330 [Deltaproteobacteria bacterium]|nr:hypothetical protein [Deltaproteobacteria bacterium]